MHDAPEELVLRPNLWTGLIVQGAMLVAAVGIVAALLPTDAPNVIALIVGGFFAVLIILGVWALLTTRITLTAQDLIVQGPFTRQRRPRAQITEAVNAAITGPRGRSNENLFLLDAQRDLVIRVASALYTREDLDRLVDALGIPYKIFNDPIAPKKFTQKYPGLLSRAERHSHRIAFTIAAALFISAMTFALAAIATN